VEWFVAQRRGDRGIDITCRDVFAGSLPRSSPTTSIAFGMARVKQRILYNQLPSCGIVEVAEPPVFPDAAGGRGSLLGPPRWALILNEPMGIAQLMARENVQRAGNQQKQPHPEETRDPAIGWNGRGHRPSATAMNTPKTWGFSTCSQKTTSPENPVHRPDGRPANVRGLVDPGTLSKLEAQTGGSGWAPDDRKASTGSRLEEATAGHHR